MGNKINTVLLIISLFLSYSHATPTSPQDLWSQALTYFDADQFDQALTYFQQLEQLYPNQTGILNNIALVLRKQNQVQEAVTYYQKALALEPGSAQLLRGASHAYLALGDFAHGLPAYEYRWKEPPYYNQELKNYIASGKSLNNLSVLIKTEYGLGDTLQFIRYAQKLKQLGATIILECQPPLVPLLQACPYIDTIIPHGSPVPLTHFHVLLMSLPLIFNTDMGTIPCHVPYLYANENLVQEWKLRIDNPSIHPTSQSYVGHSGRAVMNIGICWQAETHKNSSLSSVHKDSAAKSIPLALLMQLAELENVGVYSLQKINGLDQLEQLSDQTRLITFDDFDQTHGPFMDTAALMMHMDLIITIDTSIAHLAGGLGRPVWLLLPYAADWRWMLTRNDSPWYPTMKLFRQPHAGDWQSVIMTLKKELLEQLTKHTNIYNE